jgi:hypothetical protein
MFSLFFPFHASLIFFSLPTFFESRTQMTIFYCYTTLSVSSIYNVE